MCGPDVSSEWQVEGKHLTPLLPRLVPQTAFTVTANAMANMQAEKNLSMPAPNLTGNREGNLCKLMKDLLKLRENFYLMLCK